MRILDEHELYRRSVQAHGESVRLHREAFGAVAYADQLERKVERCPESSAEYLKLVARADIAQAAVQDAYAAWGAKHDEYVRLMAQVVSYRAPEA